MEKPGGVHRTFEWIFDHERLMGSDARPSNEGLVNLCNTSLPEVVPPSRPEEVAPRHVGEWEKATSSLNAFLADEARDGDLLAHVVWRLGREAGKIRRVLTDAGINWGFYYDHDANTPMASSHPDNFVLLPEPAPGKRPKQLVAPIEFDKAYTRESFLLGTLREGEDGHRWPTEEDIGAQDTAKYNRWLNRETYALEMSLGGDKGHANTDYAGYAGIDEHVASLLMTCITDTCVLGFRSGFNQEEDAHEMDDEVAQHAYDLLKMALCLSDDIFY